ncbi:MAG: type II toxin-antitoxin system VapB family antitoxin [Terriglobales bacterium]
MGHIVCMGRTNIVIDESLIRKARKLTGLRTKRQIVDRALDLLARSESRKGILKFYGSGIRQGDLHRTPAPRKTKVFMDTRGQAVRLPKEFQFNVPEVFIRKEGKNVILSERPFDWSAYLAEGPVASESFMKGV